MDEIIKLNGKDYLVCCEIDLSGYHYIYAEDMNSEKFTILRRSYNDGVSFVESVEDFEELEVVIEAMGKSISD